MTPQDLAFAILVSSFALFILVAYVPRSRRFLSSVGWIFFLTGGFALSSNWAPLQVRGEVPGVPPDVPRFEKPIDASTTPPHE
jgi:hypothetical protein